MADAKVDFSAARYLLVSYNLALYPKLKLLFSSVKIDVQ